MLEITLVLVTLVVVGLGGFVTPSSIATIGIAVLVLGIVIAVPTGLWYHVTLYRCMRAKISLPRTWWLSPSGLHPHLTDVERRRIDPWYRAGGIGFVLCLGGGVAAISGLLLAR